MGNEECMHDYVHMFECLRNERSETPSECPQAFNLASMNTLGHLYTPLLYLINYSPWYIIYCYYLNLFFREKHYFLEEAISKIKISDTASI